MPGLLDEVARFQGAVESTPGAWRSVDVRCVGVKRDGHFHNLLTVARLDERPFDKRGDELYADTDSLISFRTILPLERMTSFIEGVRAGEVALSGRPIHWESNLRGENRIAYSYGWSKVATALDDSWPGFATIGHELAIAGDSIDTVMDTVRGGREQLDQELRAAADPWDGIDALLEHGIRTRQKFVGYPSRLVITAELNVHLRAEDSRLADGMLEVGVETTNAEFARRCTVGYVASVGGALGVRGTIIGSKAPWRELRDRLTWLANVTLEGAESVAVFIRVGPYVVDRGTLVDERLRVQRPLVRAYNAIDPELTLLTSWLLSPLLAEQVEFERAVARVLLFCGFAVDGFAGDKRLSDAVDVLAYSATHKVLLIVECTTGPLQSKEGKLSRLVVRGNAINAAQAEYATDGTLETILVIATPLAGADISQADRSAAADDRIVVLDNQALSSLLAAARSGAGLDTALAVIRERATLTDQSSGPFPL